MKIERFADAYFFLSNFYPAPIKLYGRTWQTSEAAYQSRKSKKLKYRNAVHACIAPGLTKKEARKLEKAGLRREDWDEVKLGIMYKVVLAKFVQNKKLREALIATGKAKLIEGNYWGDTFWGVCKGTGKNKLGKILMRVRKELQQ